MIQSLIIITILLVISFLIYDIYRTNNKVIIMNNTKKMSKTKSAKQKNIVNTIMVKNFLKHINF